MDKPDFDIIKSGDIPACCEVFKRFVEKVMRKLNANNIKC